MIIIIIIIIIIFNTYIFFHKNLNIYSLLTVFEIRAVSYGSSFFSVDLWPKRKGEKKTRIRNLQYGPRKRGKQDIYYISEVNRGHGKVVTFKFSGRTVKYGPLN